MPSVCAGDARVDDVQSSVASPLDTSVSTRGMADHHPSKAQRRERLLKLWAGYGLGLLHIAAIPERAVDIEHRCLGRDKEGRSDPRVDGVYAEGGPGGANAAVREHRVADDGDRVEGREPAAIGTGRGEGLSSCGFATESNGVAGVHVAEVLMQIHDLVIAQKGDDLPSRAMGLALEVLQQVHDRLAVGASIRRVAGLHEHRRATGPRPTFVYDSSQLKHPNRVAEVSMQVAHCYDAVRRSGAGVACCEDEKWNPHRVPLARGGRVREQKDVVELALAEGAKAAEVLWLTATGSRVEVEHGRVAAQRPILEERCSVRVWLDGGRAGSAGGAPGNASKWVASAMRAAAKASEDPLSGPVDRLTADTRGLGIDDPRYPNISASDRREAILASERGARNKDRRVLTDAFVYEDRRTCRRYISSRGVAGEEWSTTYRGSGGVRVIEGDAKVVLNSSVWGRSFASTASIPYGVTMAQRALEMIGTPADLSGEVRVMLRPEVTAGIFALLAPLFAPCSTPSLLDRQEGKPLFSGKIHLIDDGGLPGGLRTHAFDDRGVSPVPLTLIKEGVIDRRYLDPREARRRETRPTGHTFGAALVPSNLMLRSGTRSINALLSEQSGTEILVVDHVRGLDTGLDRKTGALRLAASGVLHRGTSVLAPFRDVELVGDLVDVLSRVVEVASDTDRHEHVDAPGMLLDGLRVG